jgi:hypothetical protein
MPDPIEYRAFIKSYGKPVNRLITPAGLIPISSADKALRNTMVEVQTFWDTGSTLTCMKPRLRDRLRLLMARSDSPKYIAGIGGVVKADFTIVSILLASNFEIEYCPVHVLDFPSSADLLIGMDIIEMGDFAVCNMNNETSFSFIVPPLPERVNFVDSANTANKRSVP